MQAVFNHLEFRLGHNQVFALSRAASAAITVIKGSVWITQDGDLNDHILGAWQSLRVCGDAQVVVAAMSPARVSVDAPRPPRALAARLARRAMAWYLKAARRSRATMPRQRARLLLY